MQVSVFSDDQPCGMLDVQKRGLYSVFRSEVKESDLCKLYAVFSGGEIALGIPAPEHNKMTLCVSLPTGRLPAGKLLRGVLRPVREGWRPYPGGIIGNLRFPVGCVQGNNYRFPWRSGDQLPCEEVFCFFHYILDKDRVWLEIKLNEDGTPAV